MKRRLFLAAGLALVPWAGHATDAAALEAAIREAIGDAVPVEGGIELRVPALAENGAQVPLTILADSAMTEADHVRAIHVFAPRNPTPGVASFHLFPGLARARMQAAHPDVLQIYASGCSGNVTAGKWNDGDPARKETLAGRLHDAMQRAWAATVRQPLQRMEFRLAQAALGARNTPGHTETILRGQLARGERPFDRAEAAMGLAWYARVRNGHRIQVPCLDLGAAQILLLPAETYVEFQLHAQALRPASFVFVLGYGECGPGYIPVERAWREKDSNLQGWTWVPPGSEPVLKSAIRAVLAP